MRQSDIFLKTKKEFPKDEVATNAKLLIKANYIVKLMAGVYSMLPLGLRVKRKIENIIREEMNSIGSNEVLLPALHPKSIWEITGRWDELSDVMYKFKDNTGKEFGLGATHEEILTDAVKNNVNSYTDLPFSLYQIQNKFRSEERAKSGLLRGREFTMKDLYSFHEDEKSLSEFYDKVKETYLNIFKKVGLGDITYFTFASGGSFSKYSHEFQTLSEVGEDTIFICDDCRIAINKEIINDQNTCPECNNKDLREEASIEVGNIFKLGTRFSEKIGLNYLDSDGKSNPVVMGSYGIGIERLMGTVVETSNDENGIIWPESIAPFKVHLLLVGNPSGELKEKTDNIYKKLLDNNIEVLYDDRDIQPGEKFYDSDIIGIPWRLVVSNKTIEKSKIEVKKRAEDKTSLITIEEFIKNI
ncbi:MAG: aminoacyl--tRNA ligase-related protein [Candidatus Paceibacterota bacterium]